jgi:hypothetical protein
MNPAPSGALAWPLLAQVGWTLLLYAWLTAARLRAVRRGDTTFSTFLLGREEPQPIAKITRNLANQFEAPVIFYAVCVLMIATRQVAWIDVVAAWTFVAGRLIHSAVQTMTDDVPLRGRVFMISFVALVALTAHVAWNAAAGTFG